MVLLVVDSSQLIVDRLLHLITESGCAADIHTATTYEAAATLYKTVKPDVALLDMALPANQCQQLFNEIRDLADEVKFILLYSQADTIARKQYEAAGVKYILDKYHEFDQVPQALRTLAAEG